MKRELIRWTGTLSAVAVALAACTPAAPAPEPTQAPAEMTPIKLQLQWFPQAQFGGYYAALAEGYYTAEGLDVTILPGAVDIVPSQVLASGQAEFAVSWVPRGLSARQEGAAIVNIGQVFQRSGTLMVSWADSGISGVGDFAGKNIGNWGFGNEFELLAALNQAGLDPASDVTLVQQNFDMNALLNREIDAAMAMTYNEYAQVLETVNPETGELYQPSDLTTISFNDVGTAMLQDALWAREDYLTDEANQDVAVRFLRATYRGWIFCRDNVQACADHVLAAGTELGASHQLWQMNEINKLVWPAPAAGVGMMDPALWDQTIQVATSQGILSADPGPSAFRTDLSERALATLTAEGVDVVGAGFAPIEVTLDERGK
jgi:NitT/TauT family transport system substrate-binding protein